MLTFYLFRKKLYYQLWIRYLRTQNNQLYLQRKILDKRSEQNKISLYKIYKTINTHKNKKNTDNSSLKKIQWNKITIVCQRMVNKIEKDFECWTLTSIRHVHVSNPIRLKKIVFFFFKQLFRFQLARIWKSVFTQFWSVFFFINVYLLAANKNWLN